MAKKLARRLDCSEQSLWHLMAAMCAKGHSRGHTRAQADPQQLYLLTVRMRKQAHSSNQEHSSRDSDGDRVEFLPSTQSLFQAPLSELLCQ